MVDDVDEAAEVADDDVEANDLRRVDEHVALVRPTDVDGAPLER